MRIEPAPVDPSMPVFDNASERFEWLPNAARVMARGINAAQQQHVCSGARNAEGSVPPLVRKLNAAMVGEANGCDYCRTAHLLAARALGTHRNDPFIDALVDVATCIHDTRVALTDAEVERARTQWESTTGC